ncbi:MAG: hypothetical protein WC492_02230 [Candidatus Micrarchaeia archaeon]
MLKNMKGQSAMEYLMTYGWALLVIVIVIAVLMFIKPFGAPETCLFQQSGFACEGHRFSAGTTGNPDGAFYAKITNGQQKAIVVSKVACVTGSQSPSTWTAISTDNNVGAEQYIAALWSGNGVKCYDADGNVFPLEKGSDFSGRLYIQYKYKGEPDSIPVKTTIATIIGPVQ